MGKTSWQVKCALEPKKYKSRAYHRCQRCGRRRAYMRKFQICRICFRTLASWGEIPGVKKASW